MTFAYDYIRNHKQLISEFPHVLGVLQNNLMGHFAAVGYFLLITPRGQLPLVAIERRDAGPKRSLTSDREIISGQRL
jgi:hypothetical protein